MLSSCLATRTFCLYGHGQEFLEYEHILDSCNDTNSLSYPAAVKTFSHYQSRPI